MEMHWTAVNFEEPHRRAEFGALGNRSGHIEKAKDTSDDRVQGDSQGAGEHAAIQEV